MNLGNVKQFSRKVTDCKVIHGYGKDLKKRPTTTYIFSLECGHKITVTAQMIGPRREKKKSAFCFECQENAINDYLGRKNA